jgi:hypothetical protein
MNTETKIRHIEALTHLTHETELFIIKGNWEVNHTYHYKVNDKHYQIHLEIKEVENQ